MEGKPLGGGAMEDGLSDETQTDKRGLRWQGIGCWRRQDGLYRRSEGSGKGWVRGCLCHERRGDGGILGLLWSEPFPQDGTRLRKGFMAE